MRRFKPIKEVFGEAAELEPGRRETYLAAVCGEDRRLYREVNELLSTLDSGDGILGSSSIAEFLANGQSVEPLTLSPGDVVSNRFRITRLIGLGGMGEVYEAEDMDLGAHVALKTLRSRFLEDAESRSRFRREILLARRVTHPGVCRIFEFGSDLVNSRQIVYLTMELLQGQTLAERMKEGPIEFQEAVRILRQLAEGMVALHAAHVVHLDLKPANVILLPGATARRAVITDFGLARALTPGDGPLSAGALGPVLATPAYASPEQLAGKGVGPLSDIYSLGLIFFEVLCGRRPFAAETQDDSVARKRRDVPEAPSALAPIDPRWDGLILSCLEPEPERRPASFQEIVEILKSLEQAQEPAVPTTMAGSSWNGTERRRKPAGIRRAGAVALAAAALGSFLFWTPARRALCHQRPGTALFCDLPAEKDIAVYPFEIRGSSERDRALASGLARHVRESFEQLAPWPGRMCVHLRADHTSDGPRLILEGEVESAGSQLLLRLRIREGRAADARPQLLRIVERRWNSAQIAEFYAAPLSELASALEIRYPERQWQAWLRKKPAHADSIQAYLEGLGFLETGEYEKAAVSFNSVIDPARSFPFAQAHVGLGDAYRHLLNRTGFRGWELRARAAYLRAAALQGEFGFAAAEQALGALEESLGNWQGAIDFYQAALRRWPHDHSLRRRLAAANMSLGRVETAVEVMMAGAELAPMCVAPHNELADLYIKQGLLQEAEQALLSLIRLAPENAGAYHNLAILYTKQGRYDDAIQVSSQLVQLSPSALTYSAMGRALLYRGCTASAVQNLRKAVALAPDIYLVWANLAEALEALEPESAEGSGAARRAAELSALQVEKTPSNVLARAHFARNLQRLGRSAEAIEQARRVLEQRSHLTRAILIAAEVLDLAGERTLALDAVENALRIGRSTAEVESQRGLDRLRESAKYAAILQRLKLASYEDRGDLTPGSAAGCPTWEVSRAEGRKTPPARLHP